MSFLFRCPHCDTETEVEDEYAGRTGPCAVCGKSITIPQRPVEGRRAAFAAGRGPAVSVPVILAVTIIGLVLAVSIAALGVALVTPYVSQARQSAQSVECRGNLQQIALALRAYSEEHGTLPPAYFADKTGKPMHSWRVLLLPYLGHESLYRQYDFTLPWDSPENIALQYTMPAVYACPTDGDAGSAQETSYMVVVGRRTLFPGSRSARLEDARDGPANTVLLVETHTTAVCWMKPQDLDVRRLQYTMNGGVGEVSSKHRGGAHVVTADGVVHFLINDTSPEVLRGLMTVDGGETIPWRRIEDR